MPHALELPKRLKAQGWKVKIREKERLEPPHVTIMYRRKEWRLSLRDGEFLVPPGGAWDDIDDEVKKIVLAHWDMLQEAWNKKYPSNPITSTEEDDDKDS
jgi:hypothetical protein